MFYAASGLFAASIVMVCLDLAGVRFAHGAGPTATILALIGLGVLVAKTVGTYRHH